jgi:DNA-3-methyladenine glycosylase II
MPMTSAQIEAGVRHLRRADPVLKAVIRRVGPYTLKPQRDRFGMLVRSIIAQQISTAAARSINRRLHALVAPDPPTAARLAALSHDELRSAGLSPQKATYVHDLCARVADGRIELSRIGRRTDDAIIEHLVQVKGIGRWTAQMFLIFSLGRPDVFPHDDLGIRSALKNLYRLSELPDRPTSQQIAAAWSPYATIASWYLWRSLETSPTE